MIALVILIVVLIIAIFVILYAVIKNIIDKNKYITSKPTLNPKSVQTIKTNPIIDKTTDTQSSNTNTLNKSEEQKNSSNKNDFDSSKIQISSKIVDLLNVWNSKISIDGQLKKISKI